MSLSTAAPSHSGANRPLHWESWLLRAVILATVAYQLIQHDRGGAITAGEGLVVSLVPLLLQKLSRTHVPRPLEFVYVLSMMLQFCSESTKLFEHFYYWDKVVHPTMIALFAMMVAWVVLGFRDAFQVRLPSQFAAVVAITCGIALGTFWEFFEFTTDWFGNAGLQKSNGDTMTDIIANDVGATLATLLAVWLYHRYFQPAQKEQLGHLARWIGHGPSRLLDRHGRIVGAVAAVAFVAAVGAGLAIDRNPPALAAGLPAGAPTQWNFAQTGVPVPDSQVLLGSWLADPNGVCRRNVPPVEPGSEKPGLLQLNAGSAYGENNQAYNVSAHFVELRPAVTQGSQMTAGVAFGIRDADDYYALEQSALHDILRLDRYVHGRLRVQREVEYRTHGDEWHTVSAVVAGDQVTAQEDGQTVFTVQGQPDTSGGVGVWGMESNAACFDQAAVGVGNGS